MKLTVLKPTEVEASFLRINVPVYYGTEDIPADFPFRRPFKAGDTDHGTDDRWDVTVDIESGQIQGWPVGVSATIGMKVCDGGTYTLLNRRQKPIAVRQHDYVPSCIPDGGDYVEMEISGEGSITRWDRYCTPERVQKSFFGSADD